MDKDDKDQSANSKKTIDTTSNSDDSCTEELEGIESKSHDEQKKSEMEASTSGVKRKLTKDTDKGSPTDGEPPRQRLATDNFRKPIGYYVPSKSFFTPIRVKWNPGEVLPIVVRKEELNKEDAPARWTGWREIGLLKEDLFMPFGTRSKSVGVLDEKNNQFRPLDFSFGPPINISSERNPPSADPPNTDDETSRLSDTANFPPTFSNEPSTSQMADERCFVFKKIHISLSSANVPGSSKSSEYSDLMSAVSSSVMDAPVTSFDMPPTDSSQLGFAPSDTEGMAYMGLYSDKTPSPEFSVQPPSAESVIMVHGSSSEPSNLDPMVPGPSDFSKVLAMQSSPSSQIDPESSNDS